MEAIFEKIRQLAEPYLNTRGNDIHTENSTKMAYELLKREGGDKEIVIPAIILHDVGWKSVPEDLQSKAFGPTVKSPELARLHEVEGVRIAKEVLEKLNYDENKVEEILEIIDGHDSRKEAKSFNDKIVKDADKLWRYTESGHKIMSRFMTEEFGESPMDRLRRLDSQVDTMFFTTSAKEMAREELRNRFLESENINH